MLVGDELGQLVQVPLDELAEGEHDARPADERDVAPFVERLAGRRHGGVDVGRLGQRDLGLLAHRWRGSRPGRDRVDAPVVSEPAIQCWMVRMR